MCLLTSKFLLNPNFVHNSLQYVFILQKFVISTALFHMHFSSASGSSAKRMSQIKPISRNNQFQGYVIVVNNCVGSILVI